MIYFDNSATTKPSNAAVAAMTAALESDWANPSALYQFGIDAAKELLTSYTCRQSEKAWQWAKSLIRTLGEEKIAKNCAEWE